MKIHLKQEKLKWNFKYFVRVDTGNTYKAEANRTILPTPRKVEVRNTDGIKIIELKEKRILRKVLDRIPILNIFINYLVHNREKYEIYKDDVKIGEISEYLSIKIDKINVLYKGDHYVIYHKSKGKLNRFYVFHESKQVGMIDKNYITQYNAEAFNGSFINDIDELLNVIIMLFIDLCKYTKDTPSSIHSQRSEYTIYDPHNNNLDVVLDDNWEID